MQLLWLGLVIAVAGTAFADDPRRVTFAEAEGAVGAAPLAQVNGHEVAAAEALVEAARAWPAITANASTSSLTARATIGVGVPLPVFGTRGAAQRVARADAEVIRAEGAIALRDLRHRVATAWIALARADADVTASSIAAQQAAELELIAKGRLDAGTGADVDVTTARAARARAEVGAAAAIRTARAVSAELAGALGWDPAIALRSDGTVPIGDASVLAALRAKLPAHPERIAAQHRVEAAEAAVSAAEHQRYPLLVLEASVALDDRTNNAQSDATIGVGVELPLFSHVGDRVRAARASVAAQQARATVTQTELGAALVAAFERREAAVEKLRAFEADVLPAQERAAALSAQAFREGARDLSSALLAERDLASVRAEINAARADAAAAWTELQAAAGAW